MLVSLLAVRDNCHDSESWYSFSWDTQTPDDSVQPALVENGSATSTSLVHRNTGFPGLNSPSAHSTQLSATLSSPFPWVPSNLCAHLGREWIEP